MTIQNYIPELLEYLRVTPTDWELKEEGEYLFLQINVGETDTGRMIGNRGETLRALQHIISLSFQEELGDRRLVVNVNDYKQGREEKAIQLGYEAAEVAIQDQRPQDLPPLQSFERRAVHEALKDYEGVFTRSEGEGGYRRLVVYPESYREDFSSLAEAGPLEASPSEEKSPEESGHTSPEPSTNSDLQE